MKRRTLKVGAADQGQPLRALLERELSCSPEEAQRLLDTGAVYVKGRRAAADAPPLVGTEVVTVVLEERGRSVLEPSAPPPALRVLFEDSALLVVDKPPGVDAQPSPGRKGESLLDAASAHLGRAAGLVHRLDRETSGVTAFGKTDEATRALALQFREGAVRKRYLAAAAPALAAQGTSGLIELPLSKDPSRPGRYRASRTANGVPASTFWRLLHAAPEYALVALFPRTGRTHQLRAHLTALHAPILGDARYGGAPQALGQKVPRCLLHAQALSLRHPKTHAPLLLEAPVPDDLARFFGDARLRPPEGEIDA